MCVNYEGKVVNYKMGMLNILYKMYLKIFEVSMQFTHTAKEERDYLWKFSEPKNDFERSYYQYLCQIWKDNSVFRWLLMNIASIGLILPIQTYFCIQAKKKRHKKEYYDIVATRDFIANNYNFDKHTKFLNFNSYVNGILEKEDLLFLRKVWAVSPFSFYFYFKCMCRVASYSKIFSEYTLKNLYVSAEYSFTSSILTAYCERNKVRHINVMHGEKTFSIQDAFSRFHIFYVWDEFYIKLFHHLRADKTKYIVCRQNIPEFVPVYDSGKCTYYLQIHKSEELKRIKQTLDRMGLKYKVRPHPQHLSSKIKEIFGKEYVEDPFKVSIWDSLKEAGTVISIGSTVLLQAFWKGIPVIIDNISNPAYTEQLKEREYIMFDKEYELLSDKLKAETIKKGSIKY